MLKVRPLLWWDFRIIFIKQQPVITEWLHFDPWTPQQGKVLRNQQQKQEDPTEMCGAFQDALITLSRNWNVQVSGSGLAQKEGGLPLPSAIT